MNTEYICGTPFSKRVFHSQTTLPRKVPWNQTKKKDNTFARKKNKKKQSGSTVSDRSGRPIKSGRFTARRGAGGRIRRRLKKKRFPNRPTNGGGLTTDNPISCSTARFLGHYRVLPGFSRILTHSTASCQVGPFFSSWVLSLNAIELWWLEKQS